LEYKTTFPVYYLKTKNTLNDILIYTRKYLRRTFQNDTIIRKYRIKEPEMKILPLILFRGELCGFKLSSHQDTQLIPVEETIKGAFQLKTKIHIGDNTKTIEFKDIQLSGKNINQNILPLLEDNRKDIFITYPKLNPVEIWNSISIKIIKDLSQKLDIEKSHLTVKNKQAVILIVPHWFISVENQKTGEHNYIIIRDIDEKVLESNIRMKPKIKGISVLFMGSSGLTLSYIIRCILSKTLSPLLILIPLFIVIAFFSFKIFTKYLNDVKKSDVNK
jgi:hypothetical protein